MVVVVVVVDVADVVDVLEGGDDDGDDESEAAWGLEPQPARRTLPRIKELISTIGRLVRGCRGTPMPIFTLGVRRALTTAGKGRPPVSSGPFD
jgi:hypothetical protein